MKEEPKKKIDPLNKLSSLVKKKKEKKKVFVGNIPHAATEEELLEVMKIYG
jgi:RNA recognition motif-containing protein